MLMDTQDDTDDENPPDDETVRAPPRRPVFRHRCPLVHDQGFSACSWVTRQNTPSSPETPHSVTSYNHPGSESRPTHKEISVVMSGVEVVEDRSHRYVPLQVRHRQLEGQTTPEILTVSPPRLSEASSTSGEVMEMASTPLRVSGTTSTPLRVSGTTSTPLGVSGAAPTPLISVASSTTQELGSSAAHVQCYTTPTSSPSVYVTSPTYSAPAYVTSLTHSAPTATTSLIPSPTACVTTLTSSSVPHILCPEATRDPAPTSDICPTNNQTNMSSPSSSTTSSTPRPSLTRRSPHAPSQPPAPGTPADPHHTRNSESSSPKARLPYTSGLPCTPPAQPVSRHTPYSTQKTLFDRSKYEYITSREFLLRVHDLGMVMASQSIPVRNLQKLASPAQCVIPEPSFREGRRSWPSLGCISSSPESRQITPVLRQYCKSFMVAMLCPKQAPSEAMMLAPMVDTMEGRAYADDPNFKMNYCWQLATALCLILEELGRIDRAR